MARYVRPVQLSATEIKELATTAARYRHKLYWFSQNGYNPHLYQILFHTSTTDSKITRFRHLVAGRRGGKTRSAVEEILYYSLNLPYFHEDFHGKKDCYDPLWVWEISKNYKEGRPAWLTFLSSLRDKTYITKDKDYKINKSERWVEFDNGTLIEFRSAEDEDSLRGAGLDMIWMDEAAFIPTSGPYTIARPCLSDKLGGLITTSTPKGKNWFWDEFWSDKALQDENHSRVEYWSIDNPFFQEKEWKYMQDTFHPMFFKQEYMAQWDAMAGIELQGDWLHYYKNSDLPRNAAGAYDLDFYLGVDPAVSTRDTADSFAIALIGITKDRSKVYLIDTYKNRIPFPEQPGVILDWMTRPGYPIVSAGVEANAFQAALAQQVTRISGFPNVIPVISRGQKKHERILAMSPMFQLGKIRIKETHTDFIDEWVSYDSSQKNPKDDLLDAVEIALKTAGAVLPVYQSEETFDLSEFKTPSLQEMAHQDIVRFRTNNRVKDQYDDFEGDIY